MNRKELARNLAQSLALGSWSRAFIRATLVRRLPQQLHSLADGMSAELIKSLPFAYSPGVKAIASALRRSERFGKVHISCRKYDVWPDQDLSSPVMAPISAFARVDVPQLPTLDALADWLFLPIDRLEYLADVYSRYEDHVDPAANHYNYVLLAKKSGRIRIIEAPKANLKTVQRQLLHGILDKVPAHADAFGFTRGRSCLHAANRHVGEQVVICFDLLNFFPSVGVTRIFGLFRCLG